MRGVDKAGDDIVLYRHADSERLFSKGMEKRGYHWALAWFFVPLMTALVLWFLIASEITP